MENQRMLLAVYRNQDGARVLRDRLDELEDNDVIDIESAAVIVKDEDGSVSIDDQDDVDAGSGALAGAIAGGLIGLLSGPGGAVVGAAAGAATGGASAAAIDMGFDDDMLERVKNDLRPNSSALIAVVDAESAVEFEESMRDELGDSVAHYYHDVKAEVIEQWNRARDALN